MDLPGHFRVVNHHLWSIGPEHVSESQCWLAQLRFCPPGDQPYPSSLFLLSRKLFEVKTAAVQSPLQPASEIEIVNNAMDSCSREYHCPKVLLSPLRWAQTQYLTVHSQKGAQIYFSDFWTAIGDEGSFTQHINPFLRSLLGIYHPLNKKVIFSCKVNIVSISFVVFILLFAYLVNKYWMFSFLCRCGLWSRDHFCPDWYATKTLRFQSG